MEATTGSLTTAPTKPIHTLILDAGPIIKNNPSASTLLASSSTLLILPSLVSEIKDAETRARFETTLRPFVQFREPKPESVQVIINFSRKTGDLSVLSKTDIRIIALAYEVECERNGGDWRLRSVPGQKQLNGRPPAKKSDVHGDAEQNELGDGASQALELREGSIGSEQGGNELSGGNIEQHLQGTTLDKHITDLQEQADEQAKDPLTEQHEEQQQQDSHDILSITSITTEQESSSSDSEGWITPSNLRRKQAAEHDSPHTTAVQRILQVATLTSDFAMQNILMQMNLNLLSPTLTRIRHIKTHILRCHACFLQVRDMSKQFCPRCGKPTLTRVSCSTNEKGEFKIHLKQNMQWNTRGDRYSIPKPVGGSSSGKVKTGGGKGGWGQSLVFAEDQKEYADEVKRRQRRREKNLMDEDVLPGLLGGAERKSEPAKLKIGAGRNVNSRRRR